MERFEFVISTEMNLTAALGNLKAALTELFKTDLGGKVTGLFCIPEVRQSLEKPNGYTVCNVVALVVWPVAYKMEWEGEAPPNAPAGDI